MTLDGVIKVRPSEDSLEHGNLRDLSGSKNGLVVRPGGISAFQALANLVKAMIGAGVLSLPLAFKQSGLWCALVLMIIFGWITYITYKKLVRCSQYLVRTYNYEQLDYGTMMEESFKTSFRPIRKFAVFARYLVNFSLFLLQIGICSVYFVFVRTHLIEIVHHVFPSFTTSPWIYTVVVLGAYCLLVMIRHIKAVSYVSLTGNILMTICLVVIFQELVRAEHIISKLPAYENVNGVIMAAGSIVYSYVGQATVLPVENKMKFPHRMLGATGVLSVGCTIVTIVYTACGFFGYITYGSAVQGSITLNLPDTTLFFWLKILLTLVVFTTFLIQHYVIVDMAMPWIREHCEKGSLFNNVLVAELIVRLVLVLISFGLAIGVPNLEDIIPLVGLTAGMLLALVLPALVDTTTFLPGWIERREYLTMTYNMVLNIILFVGGLFFLVTGFISNLNNIIHGN